MANTNNNPAKPARWVDKGDGELVLENSPRPGPQSPQDLRKQLQDVRLKIKRTQE